MRLILARALNGVIQKCVYIRKAFLLLILYNEIIILNSKKIEKYVTKAFIDENFINSGHFGSTQKDTGQNFKIQDMLKNQDV